MSSMPSEPGCVPNLLERSCRRYAGGTAGNGSSNEGYGASRLDVLLTSVARGEMRALTSIDTSVRGMLFGVANRILRNRADAEEVVGDVLLRVWDSAAEFDRTRGSAAGWLVAICRNAAIDKLRSRILEGRVLYASAESSNVSKYTPESLVQELQQRSSLQRLIGKLTPLQRQMIALAFFRDLSHCEISRIAGLPLGTVKSHIRRALGDLRCSLVSSN
jgi:RNA polymerase sigma-70 factor (ECF subfamily)